MFLIIDQIFLKTRKFLLTLNKNYDSINKYEKTFNLLSISFIRNYIFIDFVFSKLNNKCYT